MLHRVALLSRPDSMPRFKQILVGPRLVAVDLAEQLIPGTFEHAVNHLLDHAVDLSVFDARFHNDETGAPAYPPAVLLKVVLVAYAHGVISSRGIERLCRDHITFIALCGGTTPHFTTIAAFISTVGEEFAHLFGAVVAICMAQGLVGREMFAIDGVKLPSNASKHRSGTRADFEKQATKLEAAAQRILERHRAADALPVEPTLAAKEQQRITKLEEDAAKIREWLVEHPDDRRGPKGRKRRQGNIRQSNRTDNASAKMATGKGVIQGYTGVAAVDAKTQIIVEAQAHGTGSEQEVLLPVIDAMRAREALLIPTSLVTADAGYHSEENLKALAEREVDALIADNAMRKRDERFAKQEHHRAKPDPLHDKSPEPTRALPLYQPSDFTWDRAARTCTCPAGKSLYRKGKNLVMGGYLGDVFRGAKRDCGPCARRAQCLQHPESTPARQVAFLHGPAPNKKETHTARMKARIDTPEGRAQYGRRFGAVEPVFANMCYNKGLTRFTLRGQAKVDGQWKLYCMVHNIEKLAHHGYAPP